MNDIAIRCEGLSKQYRIGERDSYRTLRDTIADTVSAPFRLFSSTFRGVERKIASRHSPSFWALKDLSFEIKRGDVVGIIGRNGAGKSTLLKILSRITAPTEGEVEISGRVGSLLEVGTGFHPELTGRDNIFLNGAILGMRKSEIALKFDEIVAFAEIEKFIDTPVKRYSSGMYVRLAFAVAVHLEPEVMIVDEVLAVGDAEFQKKCFGKMQEVGREGRTILFVSHNMSALRNLCKRGIVLDKGKLIAQGNVDYVVDEYLSQTTFNQDNLAVIETDSFVVNDVKIVSPGSPVIKTFDPVEIRVRFTPKIDILDPGLYVGILSIDGHRIAGLDFKDFQTVPAVKKGEQGELGFVLESFPILPGSYQLELHLKDMARHKIEFVSQTYQFQVVESPVYGGRKIDSWYGHIGLNANARSFITSD